MHVALQSLSFVLPHFLAALGYVPTGFRSAAWYGGQEV
jgi:hypothetical protein